MKRLLSIFLALAVCQMICCYGKSATGSETERLTDKQLERLIEKLVGESDDDTIGTGLVERVKGLDRDERRNSRKKSRNGSLQKKGKRGVRRDLVPRKDLDNVANGTVSLESCNDGGELQRNMDTQEAHCPEGFFVGVDLVRNWSKVKNKKVREEAKRVREPYSKIYYRPACLSFSCSSPALALNFGYSHLLPSNVWLEGIADFSFGRTSKKIKEGFYESLEENGGKSEGKIYGNSYSLKAKMGYYFNEIDTVFYGIFGLKWVNVKFRLISPVDLGNSMKRLKPSIGCGFEKALCSRGVSFCVEYEYSWAKSSSCSKANSPLAVDPPLDFLSHSYDSKFHEHSLRVGLKCYLRDFFSVF